MCRSHCHRHSLGAQTENAHHESCLADYRPVLRPNRVVGVLEFGRGRSAPQRDSQSTQAPFWQKVFTGICPCGAGCTLGDFAGEWMVFLSGLTIADSILWADFAADFVPAYLIGIVFQYFAIAPMRNLSDWPRIRAAIKADTASLAAFEIGMFAWMRFLENCSFSLPLSRCRRLTGFPCRLPRRSALRPHFPLIGGSFLPD